MIFVIAGNGPTWSPAKGFRKRAAQGLPKALGVQRLRSLPMKNIFAVLIAAALASPGLPVLAQEQPAINKQEAKDLATQSKAEYEARKDLADANHELNKADCEITEEGGAERACKKEAKALRKAQKAEAKQIHEGDKQAIKALSDK